MPVEGIFTEIEPRIHAHTKKNIHLQAVRFRQDRLDGVVCVNLRASREQFGRIISQSFIARAGDPVPAIVFLIPKALLNNHCVHAQAVHTTNLVVPVGVGQPSDRRIPMAAFLLAPVCDAYPGAIDRTSGANVRGKYFQIAHHANRAARVGCDKDQAMPARPLLSRMTIVNADVAMSVYFHVLLMEQSSCRLPVQKERERILSV